MPYIVENKKNVWNHQPGMYFNSAIIPRSICSICSILIIYWKLSTILKQNQNPWLWKIETRAARTSGLGGQLQLVPITVSYRDHIYESMNYVDGWRLLGKSAWPESFFGVCLSQEPEAGRISAFMTHRIEVSPISWYPTTELKYSLDGSHPQKRCQSLHCTHQ